VDYNTYCYQCGQYIGTVGCGCGLVGKITYDYPQHSPTIAYISDPQTTAKLDEIIELLKELRDASSKRVQ